jgi:hypothetical protein
MGRWCSIPRAFDRDTDEHYKPQTEQHGLRYLGSDFSKGRRRKDRPPDKRSAGSGPRMLAGGDGADGD